MRRGSGFDAHTSRKQGIVKECSGAEKQLSGSGHRGMNKRSRREFLRDAGLAAGGAAALRRFSTAQVVAETGPADLAKIRGLMVDAGRVPEQMKYYRRVVEFCAEWELNALQFRLADDQGSAMRFASVPGLLTHKNAFAPDDLRGLAEYAKAHGVDLIPELESFGHTGYITRSAAYAHLLDRGTDPNEERDFTGVIPLDPETLRLFEKLYGEVATIFPSAYLHGGCDEVNWGGSALSRKALETKSRAQVWAEYLNSLNGVAKGLGKQFIVWGDFVVHKEPEILGKLDKRIIVMDWNYGVNSSAKVRETYLKVRANGSRGIGAPGLINYRWGARAGTEQLRNIDAYAEAYLEPDDANSLGVILTNWIPSRYIQDSIWDGFAYGAVAFQQGTAVAQTSAFRRFVEKHYGAAWDERWDEMFRLIYDYAPYMRDRATESWMGVRLVVPWGSDEELTAAARDTTGKNPFEGLKGLCELVRPSVRRNAEDFEAFGLCMEYLEGLYWREGVVAGAFERESAAKVIREIAERDAAMAKLLTEDWDQGRPTDSPAKSGPVFDLRLKDQMLYASTRAADYSASLAGDADRFYRLTQARS